MSSLGRGRGKNLPAWMTHGGNNLEGRRDVDPDRHRHDDRDGRHNDDYHDRRPDPPMGRGRGRGLGYTPGNIPNRWDRSDRPDLNFVRESNHDNLPPAGRGRGRGRGANINRPAWMEDGGPTRMNEDMMAKDEKKDETMEQLLLKAREVQQQQLSKKSSTVASSQPKVERVKEEKVIKEKEKDRREEEEQEKQQQLISQEEKRKKEEERIRLEMEQEEQRQLMALVDEDGSKKRSLEEEEEGLFEFETEEEREERMARQRREERRKKLRGLESNGSGGVGLKVDEPRNAAGVIASEMEGVVPTQSLEGTTDDQDNDIPIKQEDASTKHDSDDDSFDIFAADNPTPIPTQNKDRTTISRSNIAQECDDAEGYYKANIGEIITVPKYRGENNASAQDDTHARFRVQGIIGKGVFSTVIKVVEESNNNDHSNPSVSREIAMKIIRNNEIMAKAASKEMRILRMLCHRKNNHDNEIDPEEKERRERENHNIVRLLEVDPTFVAKDSSSYAIPPPEFRSHCLFLFEFLPYNLREVLSKFGKGVGITLTAVKSYARQLLSALGHLERHRVVHGEKLLINYLCFFPV